MSVLSYVRVKNSLLLANFISNAIGVVVIICLSQSSTATASTSTMYSGSAKLSIINNVLGGQGSGKYSFRILR